MSEQEQSTTTTTDTTAAPIPWPEPCPEWEVRVGMVSPRSESLRTTYTRAEPNHGDIRDAVQWATRWAEWYRYYGEKWPPKDWDGRRIIAFEALVEVRVVDPAGTERVVERVREIVGWETLRDYEERARVKGDGWLEPRDERDPTTGEWFTRWVWRACRRRRGGKMAQP